MSTPTKIRTAISWQLPKRGSLPNASRPTIPASSGAVANDPPSRRCARLARCRGHRASFAAFLGFEGAMNHSMAEVSGGLTMAISGTSLAGIGLVIFPRT